MHDAILAEVGKFYMVPCVRLPKAERRWQSQHHHPAQDASGWIPVIGPEHHDRETIGFNAMHFHVDARFVSVATIRHYDADPWRRGYDGPQRLLGHPVSTWSDGIGDLPIAIERSVRKKKCQRACPDFPRSWAIRWLPQLEAEHGACKLKPGNICPHRGIDLTPFVKPDGTVICPGHGLRWDTLTGDLLPYQAGAA